MLNQIMLKRFALLATVSLGVSLAACGGSSDDPAPPAPAAPPPAAPPPPPPPPPPYPAGLSDATITVNGTTRNFRIHVPGSASLKAIVLVLHGGGGSGTTIADGGFPTSVFRTVADREGFVVVYPEGLPAADGGPAWADCRGDSAVASNADDIRFLDALIERLRMEFTLEAWRVFMTGSSNGGLMSMAYAFQRPAGVGAIATASANLPLNPKPGACTSGPPQPVPILMTHGTADPQMPFAGGCVANFGGACSRGQVVSTEATLQRWLQINGLQSIAPVTSTVDLYPDDAGPARRFDYAGAPPVQWWRLDGAGHTAPSRIVPIGFDFLVGPQNRDIEFAEVVWEFFAARLP